MAQAGARFETYVKAAMAEAELPTLAELYRQSGIGASTWNAWFRGQRQPRGNSLRLAGQTLGRTPEQLRAVWEGDRPQKPRKATGTADPLVSALHRQSEAIESLVDELSRERADQREATVALLRAVAAVAQAPPGTLADRKPSTPVDSGR